MIDLTGKSTPGEVYDALAELDDRLPGARPDGLTARMVRDDDFDSGPTYEMATTTRAWVVGWDHYSIYRGRTVRSGRVLLDQQGGGLAPDGFAFCRRAYADLPRDDDELRALMLLMERQNWPRGLVSEEY